MESEVMDTHTWTPACETTASILLVSNNQLAMPYASLPTSEQLFDGFVGYTCTMLTAAPDEPAPASAVSNVESMSVCTPASWACVADIPAISKHIVRVLTADTCWAVTAAAAKGEQKSASVISADQYH